jgi:hypothetical protein
MNKPQQPHSSLDQALRDRLTQEPSADFDKRFWTRFNAESAEAVDLAQTQSAPRRLLWACINFLVTPRWVLTGSISAVSLAAILAMNFSMIRELMTEPAHRVSETSSAPTATMGPLAVASPRSIEAEMANDPELLEAFGLAIESEMESAQEFQAEGGQNS